VPSAQHDLRDVVAQLDAKIRELQSHLTVIPDIPQNAECRRQMNESLAHAQAGKKVLFDSCCSSQICNFSWQEYSST
jgi:phage shock protein A